MVKRKYYRDLLGRLTTKANYERIILRKKKQVKRKYYRDYLGRFTTKANYERIILRKKEQGRKTPRGLAEGSKKKRKKLSASMRRTARKKVSAPIALIKSGGYVNQTIMTNTGDKFYLTYSSNKERRRLINMLISRYAFDDFNVLKEKFHEYKRYFSS